MFDSYFTVTFSRIKFGDQPTLDYKVIKAPRFFEVEEWAFANCPDGFYVWTIEKTFAQTSAEMPDNYDAELVI